MGGWDTAAGLPSSHVFLTAAWGQRQKTVAAPRWAVMLVAALGVVGSLWSCGATVYVLGHDSLLAAAMRRERDLQYDYEDRIAVLQRRLERTSSQQAQLERTVGTRLDVLTAQEGELRRKAGAVADLAEAVSRLTPHTAAAPMRQAATPGANAVAAPAALPAGDHDAMRDLPPSEKTADRLATLTRALGAIDTDQQQDLTRLQATATGHIAQFRDALSEAGLSLARFGNKAEGAAGGPFVPLDAQSAMSSFERASLALRATLDEAGKLRTAVMHIPFDKPLGGTPEVTSPFGARVDPFLGRPAMHTGIDLREDTGTEVLVTAPGRVVSAGPASGYGIMVEVDHGSGLSTRYAHLSAVTVAPGQQVDRGETVGLVGATGRATGPHLHYETRIDGEPVDPVRFLLAGHRLAEAHAL